MQTIHIQSEPHSEKGSEPRSEQLKVTLLSLGARLAGIRFSNKELALSYSDTEKFKTDPFYLGASIGPITNRIANSSLTVHNESFSLPANEGINCLHSGGNGFDKLDWSIIEQSESHVVFELDFNLVDVGMSGMLKTQVIYRVTGHKLTVEYKAQCDQDTYVNTTNHVYFNLSGHSLDESNRTISDHQFRLYAQNFVAVDEYAIPNGTTTPIDSPLAYSINDDCPHKALEGSVDHHFNTDAMNDVDMKLMLEAKSNESGIQMRVNSNSPGFQFYTAKHLGKPFTASGGFCVETQYAPDAINQSAFFSPLLKSGEPRKQITEYCFSVDR